MAVRVVYLLLALLIWCGSCHAAGQRWTNFAEDGDARYYLDTKTKRALPDNVYVFWVKSIPKNAEFFKSEYNLNDVAYLITNYELDCALSSYRVRGAIMFDKNRREINKTVAPPDSPFEPIPPESLLELAQQEVCVNDEGEEAPGSERPSAAAARAPRSPAGSSIAPAPPAAPEVPAAPPAPDASGEPELATGAGVPAVPSEPPSLQ